MRDYLTGLYTRQDMYELWPKLSEESEVVQVLFADVDNFKTINDMYGHRAGDKTLRKMAELLTDRMPVDSYVVRLGGDEFIVIIPGEYSQNELEDLAGGLLKSISREGQFDKSFEIISASIGIVMNARTGLGLDELMSYSDSAMYFAKQNGKNTYVFFHDYEERIRDERQMEKTAEEAFAHYRFEVLYYPVYHLQNSKLIRTVATPVWRMEDGSLRYRRDFDFILEKSGLLRKIDMLAFEDACMNYAAMDGATSNEVIVCVRIGQLILDDDITGRLLDIAGEYDVPAGSIELLIDERLFGGRSVGQLLKNIGSLDRVGFGISIVDFGSDFSSVRYLDKLSLISIWFDRDYLKENLSDRSGSSMLKTLFGMGRDMRVLSVALGVDAQEQALDLIKLGCDAAAGLNFSEPIDVGSYVDMISREADTSIIYEYEFNKNLITSDERFPGEVAGDGVSYVTGISDLHGGLKFDGGPMEENIVKFPGGLFVGGSFTITMWLRPREVQNWISALFIRMKNGFISFMPHVSGNISMFRIHPDGEMQEWTDAMCAALPVGEWTYVGLVYDSFSSTSRVYINGEFAVMQTDIPDLGAASVVYLGGDCYQVSYCGEISALRIYEGVRTDDQIRESYRKYLDEPGFHGEDKADDIMEYPTHDPAVYEDPVSKNYYIYATHNQCMVSDDMRKWESVGGVITDVPDEAYAWTGSKDIWAPDIVKVDNEYRLYCSNSSWGVQRSCIFMAKSDSAAGPFEPAGIVLKTDETLDVNGIDANIITDHKTGDMYMVYGSFWGGVHILPLDRKTGLVSYAGDDGSGVGSLKTMPGYKEGMTVFDLSEKEREIRRGKCLARRPIWCDGAIEGPYIIYLEKTGYYYLFVSYGSLKTDYNIRIGRSRNVTGPYLDYFGNDMADPDDPDMSRGLMVSAGYHWLDEPTYMGPGHNSVLVRENGDIFLVSHIRHLRYSEDDPGGAFLQIRRMFTTPDDWLIAAAEPYSEETFRIARDPVIPGRYERIELTPSMPQGIMHAHPLILHEDGRLEMCSVMGTWKKTDEYTLQFEYGPVKEFVHIEKGTDYGSKKTTVMLAGLNSRGVATWGKKL